MAALQIRTMHSFDIGAVMAVERSGYSLPWSESVMSDCLLGNYNCEVALSADEMVAHMISQQILDELHLLNLCVVQHRQREGFGLQMLQHLIDYGRSQQVQRVLLEVRASNMAALTLYKTLGFEAIGLRKGYYRADSSSDKQLKEDAVVMSAIIGT